MIPHRAGVVGGCGGVEVVVGVGDVAIIGFDVNRTRELLIYMTGIARRDNE